MTWAACSALLARLALRRLWGRLVQRVLGLVARWRAVLAVAGPIDARPTRGIRTWALMAGRGSELRGGPPDRR